MKIKRLMNAVIAVAMVGINVFSGILPVLAADSEDPTIQNPDPVTLDDGVVLSKTVKSVEGYANKWEVTLRIESPKTEKTSDTVIVIDRSGSMGSDNRLTNAKAAARSLAQQLLPEGNTTNRVAVVSFASSASNSGTGTDFTDDYDTVSSAIGRMNANGGTYTQSAIHMAAEMLSSSTADIKTMILLSDGEPTYSVPFTRSARDDNDNFVAYGNELETSSEVDQSVFNYTNTGRVGNGSNLRQCIGETDWWGNCLSGKYYNNGNSAIAEAGYFKDSNNGTLYTIALDAGEIGTPILNAIASPNKHYTATPSELTTIFNEIGGNILSLIQSASVEDTMGHGVVVSGTGDTTIEWEPEFTLQGDVFVAETSYIVEMDEDVYDQTPVDGFYSLNKSAILTYNDGKTGEFPVPKAKPFALNVEKELTVVDENGNSTTQNNKEFKFKVSGNDKEYSVYSGGHNVIKVPMPIKLGTEYTVTETGVGDDSEVAFEYYNDPEYSVKYAGVESAGNKFTITADHGDEIDVKIKNVYEKTSISASKNWVDDSNRDGLRSDYNDLYVAIKDGNNYVKIAKISTDKDKSTQEFSFDNLPKNRNGSEIEYTVVEARDCSETNSGITCASEFTGDENYAVTIKDGVITNKHDPEKTTLTIKKKWDVSAGTLPTVKPELITVEVSNDKNDTVEPVTLRGQAYNEWTGNFEGYKYEDGEKINYTVTAETKIGDNAFETGKNTLYIYENDVLEGKWVASCSGMEVTNTWTPAAKKYTGAGEFTIKKLDQDGKALSGVTFEVNGEEYTTGNDGTVKVVFSESEAEPEDSYTFKIEETDAPDNYALIEGTEKLGATTSVEITPVEEELTNYYEKTFTFSEKTPVEGYVWDGDELILTATDQALAKELKIVKSFEGITAEAFANNSNISFSISGPDSYSNTVSIDDEECGMKDGDLVCVVGGLLPIGEYTVTESNAEIENFTYKSEPTSGKISKTVKLGETAEFKFKNIYEPVKTASYKVKKIWEDDGDRDGVRPDKLEVTLYADDEVYGDPVELSADDWSYEWTELPLVNENAEEVEYLAVEEDLGDYDSDGGEMKDGVFTITNTHTPETKNIVIKKTWDVSKGNLPTANPTFITVELSNNGGEKQTVTLEGTGYGEWESDEISVYANVGGEAATYQVKETGIDGSNLDNAGTLYIYNGDVLEGKWVAEENELTVKNTWTPAGAHYEYNGESKFEILKVNESGETLGGVTFNVNDQTKTTNGSGKIEVEVPISDNKAEEEFEFTISEEATIDGYELAEGSATITVTCTSEWASADEKSMLNIYTKTCEFSGEGDDAFDWDGNSDPMTLTVTNVRSTAASLTIEKTFSGVSEAELQGLTFTITGPEDFGDNGEMVLKFSDDCIVNDDVAICEVEEAIPTGEYTVKENNAELENYTLTVTGDNETQDVEKDAEVVFEITNEYKKIDPCADGEGCGGDVPVVPPITPDTGMFTIGKGEIVTDGMTNWIGGAMVATLAGISVIMFGVGKLVNRAKNN